MIKSTIDFDSFSKKQLTLFLDSNSLFVYRLTGGLGNQLFGLSEAFRIAKIKKREILLDLSRLEHHENISVDPIWLNYVLQTGKFFIGKNFPLELNSQIKFENLDQDNANSNFITGWNPSIDNVINSNLWTKGLLPDFLESEIASEHLCAIHIRLGDYKFTPPFSPLPWEYYELAINKIGLNFDSISVFSDEPDSVKLLYPELENYNVNLVKKLSIASSLKSMSKSNYLIMGNSTFSFWAYYFGNHKKVLYPKPFYDFNPSFSKNFWLKTDTSSNKLIGIAYESRKAKLIDLLDDLKFLLKPFRSK